MDEQDLLIQPIAVVRGTSASFSVDVIDKETGEPYELQTGEFFRFGVKLTPNNTEYLIEKIIDTANEADEYAFSIVPNDTIELPFGTFYYDVGLQSGIDYYPIIPTSPFELCANITSWAEEA